MCTMRIKISRSIIRKLLGRVAQLTNFDNVINRIVNSILKRKSRGKKRLGVYSLIYSLNL